MKILLNNKEVSLPQGSTLHVLLLQENITLLNVAVAVNNTLVLRDKWATTMLNEGDNVVAITAAYGG